MQAGYYVTFQSAKLISPKHAHKIVLHRDEWLYTDGVVVGKFDKEDLEWVPVMWDSGHELVLDEELSRQLFLVVMDVSLTRIKDKYRELVEVEPGDIIPNFPVPPTRGLATYLRARRRLFANYDWR